MNTNLSLAAMEDLDLGPYIEINFECRKDSHKHLIDFILHFGNFELKELAELIEENIDTLKEVTKGKASLSEKSIINLVQLYHMFALYCEFEH